MLQHRRTKFYSICTTQADIPGMLPPQLHPTMFKRSTAYYRVDELDIAGNVIQQPSNG